MPVFSYLAYPTPGHKDRLLKDLATIDGCEVTPSDNTEVLILVTDTSNESQEKALQNRLNNLETLQSLSLTFGHVDQ